MIESDSIKTDGVDCKESGLISCSDRKTLNQCKDNHEGKIESGLKTCIDNN